MARTRKACWNCANFGLYYKRGEAQFYKTNKGSCSITHEDVEKHGYCEHWRNTFTLRSVRKRNVMRALNATLSDLQAIKQILEEEDEECKTHPHHTQI